MTTNFEKASKYMSFLLRHKPEAGGLTLDKNGFVNAEDLIRALNDAGFQFDIETLNELVKTCDKKRFAFDADAGRIRAVQGHSQQVDLQLARKQPPDILYHGTVERFMEQITNEGLVPKDRQYVHLSKDEATASTVGARRGKPIILKIDSRKMHEEGFRFFLAENGVWLTARVPPQFFKRSPLT